jgi:hypothetical protein
MYIAEKDNKYRLVSPHETSEKQIKLGFEILELAALCHTKMREFVKTYGHQGFIWDFSPNVVMEVRDEPPKSNRIGFK